MKCYAIYNFTMFNFIDKERNYNSIKDMLAYKYNLKFIPYFNII